jgi:acyl-coenzyme A synthetase/AMP-(fatty) acid ligase
MYSTKFQPNKPFFVTPDDGPVKRYANFLQDLNHSADLKRESSQYSTICQVCHLILTGSNFCFRDNNLEVETDLEAKREIHADNFASVFAESNSQIRLMTSGTTGIPKTVTHDVHSLTRGIQVSKNHSRDVWGLAYPLEHLSGLQVLFQAILNGNTIVQLFGYSGRTIHTAIQDHSVTHLSCTPTFLKLLGTESNSHKNVRRLTTGGERIDSNTRASINQLFPNAKHRNIYALTEVGNLFISDGEIFTVPRKLNELICILDETLAIHRSLLANFVPENQAKSGDWYITGDLVDIIETNPLRFKFRARHDDIINVGGYKVTPQIVEKLLGEIDGVKQALVYGEKNSVTGEIVACDIVAQPGHVLETDLIRQQLSGQLPRHAIPRIINMVASLKITTNGKLCRHKKQSS